MLELWNYGIMELWNVGIMELWNVGMLECWNIGMLRLSRNPASVGEEWKFGGVEHWKNVDFRFIRKKKAHQWQAFLSNFWFEELFDHDAFCGYIAIDGPDL
jgi:hypothetical protein